MFLIKDLEIWTTILNSIGINLCVSFSKDPAFLSNVNKMFSDVHYLKHNHLIGIADTAKESGKFLLKEYFTSLQNSEIHIFCYDCSCEEFSEEFGISPSVATFYNCLPEIGNEKRCDKLQKFVSSIKLLQCTAKKLTVVIDSLSTVLLENSLQSVYQMLRYFTYTQTCLGRKFQLQVVLMIHEDSILNTKYVTKHLKHLCRVWIQVHKSQIILSMRKTSGKVTTLDYEYKFTTDNNFKIQKKKQIIQNVNEKKGDNTPISTFRLSLNETEKQARDAVQLPYERRINLVSEKGEIFYEPDEFDDWDEEDPDNDLEFS